MFNSGIKIHRFSFVLFAILIACNSVPDLRVVEESWPNGREKKVRYYKNTGNQKELTREIFYYESGQKEVEGEFRKGERHGQWTYWYENGNIWSEGEFKNGLSHGYRKVYHSNGKLFYEGKFKNDKPVGTWKFFDEDGRFIKEETY